MVLLYKHKQEKKKTKKQLTSNCYLTISSDESFLEYTSEFYSEFIRLGKTNSVTFFHSLRINKKTGDFSVGYTINTDKTKSYRLYKPGQWIKKNNFFYLKELIVRGFYNGENRAKYWGVKYDKALKTIFEIILSELKPAMHDSYLSKSSYEDKPYINPLYDFIVDFHLNKKKIKGHDDVYGDILYEYPKSKWLKKNDYKFIPAVLDSYGIKSGFLIKRLSTRNNNEPVIMKSLNFICKLFGENYVDYFNRFDWLHLSTEKVNIKKYFTCKNESEKTSLVNTLNNWDDTSISLDGKLKSIHELFYIREKIEERGLEFKFKSRNTNDFSNIIEKCRLHYKYIKVGYKLRYAIPQNVVEEIEEPIICGDKTYYPKLVNTEDQFRIEGHLMKNCMATQFNLGSFYLYVSIASGKKRVNVQYRKGMLTQARGKANIDLPNEFQDPVTVLSQRIYKFKDLSWVKEKYDYITK